MSLHAHLSTPIDLGHGRRSTLLELIEAWAAHVLRLHSDVLEPSPDGDAWGIDDFVAALFLRDQTERGLQASGTPRPALLEATDRLFLSFTTMDGRGLVPKVEPAATLTEWWWLRIPNSGPVADEFNLLAADR